MLFYEKIVNWEFLSNGITKIGNIIFFKVSLLAASTIILISLGIYFLSIKPGMEAQFASYTKEIELNKEKRNHIENQLQKKTNTIKELDKKYQEVNKRFLENEKFNRSLFQKLTHYKKRIREGAFYYNDMYAYNTKGIGEKTIISPEKNQLFKKGQSISFNRQNDLKIRKFAIYDNKDNLIFQKEVSGDSSYTFTKSLDFGIYYWKLEYKIRKPAEVGWFQVYF